MLWMLILMSLVFVFVLFFNTFWVFRLYISSLIRLYSFKVKLNGVCDFVMFLVALKSCYQ